MKEDEEKNEPVKLKQVVSMELFAYEPIIREQVFDSEDLFTA